MNGPQRTACLAKGYINSELAMCVVAIDSDSTMQQEVPIPATHWKQIPPVRTAAETATTDIANIQELCTPPRAGGHARIFFLGRGWN